MNKELALKLKKAGFPQVWPKPDFMEIQDALKMQEIVDKYKDEVYYPTLSELIEACGDKFYGLHKLVDGQWLAFMFDIDDSTRQVEVYARTAEEAIARLWLTLNKE